MFVWIVHGIFGMFDHCLCEKSLSATIQVLCVGTDALMVEGNLSRRVHWVDSLFATANQGDFLCISRNGLDVAGCV